MQSSLHRIWRSGTRRWHLRVPDLQMSCSQCSEWHNLRYSVMRVVPTMTTKVTCPIPPYVIEASSSYQTPIQLQTHNLGEQTCWWLGCKKECKVDTYPLWVLWRARLRGAHERHVALVTTLHLLPLHVELARPILKEMTWIVDALTATWWPQ